MAGWTLYGKQQLFAVGTGAIDPPILYLALYSTSADPAGPPTELVLAGYGRVAVDFALDSVDHASNAGDVDFGPLEAGSYLGVAVLDDPAIGGVWFWDDEPGPVVIADASIVSFAAGTLDLVRTA